MNSEELRIWAEQLEKEQKELEEWERELERKSNRLDRLVRRQREITEHERAVSHKGKTTNRAREVNQDSDKSSEASKYSIHEQLNTIRNEIDRLSRHYTLNNTNHLASNPSITKPKEPGKQRHEYNCPVCQSDNHEIADCRRLRNLVKMKEESEQKERDRLEAKYLAETLIITKDSSSDGNIPETQLNKDVIGGGDIHSSKEKVKLHMPTRLSNSSWAKEEQEDKYLLPDSPMSTLTNSIQPQTKTPERAENVLREVKISNLNEDDKGKIQTATESHNSFNLKEIKLSNLHEDNKEKIQAAIENHDLSSVKEEPLGSTNIIQHKITTTTDTPIYERLEGTQQKVRKNFIKTGNESNEDFNQKLNPRHLKEDDYVFLLTKRKLKTEGETSRST